MSYGIYLYDPSVMAEVTRGRELDKFEHRELNAGAVEQFVSALEQYGYVVQSRSKERSSFIKSVGASKVEASIWSTEIAFTVAGSDEDAVFEALQDASELLDPDHMVLFDPQTGEWQGG